ncbi:MAG: recombinase family protein [Armatimonadetes bacterium]|nr:recombinase family protein [Armatimonadota bacterium]
MDNQKVTARHLQRRAYLYVRQSTLRQVIENTESAHRQYALRERAVALGWPPERVVVIDEDLGQSGASAAGREGFQRLVADVSLGLVGIILGLEVSRLARCSSDWYRLLEICALTDTLILDEEGLYDPNSFNDRLLLGLKGTMSEAELHFLKMRMRGGVLSKARRGELKGPLPVGLVYGPDNQVHLDPDQQVQETLQLFFATFRRTGAATATVKAFGDQGLLFPRRLITGPHKGELAWSRLTHCRALQTLKNPRYAGAFFYGRRQRRKGILPREEWISLLPEAHAGYISWDEFEENQRRLRDNARAVRAERRSPPREGPALLQGLVICGRCGLRMSVQYRTYRKKMVPDYVCSRRHAEYAEPCCQRIPGRTIDEAVGQLLVESVTPLALDAVLAVDDELQQRADEVKRLLQHRVQRAQYEADLAQRRYLQVDPDNRLVANTLEAEWNNRLRDLEEAKRHFEEEMKTNAVVLTAEKRQQIRDLAVDFPRLWQDPRTPDRERKRMARLLIEDVTLIKEEMYTVHVRFRGGALRTIRLPLLPNAPDAHRTPRQVIEEIDRLLDHHSEEEIAVLLNERGFRSGTGQLFDKHKVIIIRWTHKLKDRYTRLREAGFLTKEEIAERLGIRPDTVLKWRKQGLLQGIPYAQKGGREWLFPVPADDLPARAKHKRSWLERNSSR